MSKTPYAPVFEILRAGVVESVHYGSIAVCNQDGDVLAYYGNIETTTFLRSLAKPFQAIPLVETGGLDHYGLTEGELAIICGSHSGTDGHLKVLEVLQKKIGIDENDLVCGRQQPIDEPTALELVRRGEIPSPNRHNCSGNHSGILAYSKLLNLPLSNYYMIDHPVQQKILDCISEMSRLNRDEIIIGGDGCAIPTYGVKIRIAATMYARICNPCTFNLSRSDACEKIVKSMARYPEMIAGPNRLDTDLVNLVKGDMISKTGIEGYQAVGVRPSNNRFDSIGIAVKISDGDYSSRARPAVVVEVLRQLNLLSSNELENLKQYGPIISFHDSKQNIVAMGRPTFKLHLNRSITQVVR